MVLKSSRNDMLALILVFETVALELYYYFLIHLK